MLKVSSLPTNGSRTVLTRLEQTLHGLSMSPPPIPSPAAFLAFKILDFQGGKES